MKEHFQVAVLNRMSNMTYAYLTYMPLLNAVGEGVC